MRRILILAAVAALALSACGEDEVPTRAEFIESVTRSAEADLDEALSETGTSAADALPAIETFAGCVYDKVSDDADLLRDLMNETASDSLTSELDERASECLEGFQREVTELVTPTTVAG